MAIIFGYNITIPSPSLSTANRSTLLLFFIHVTIVLNLIDLKASLPPRIGYGYTRSLQKGKNATATKVNTKDKPCSINEEQGICVFTSECVKRKGIILGHCRDGFLFGACCSINPNASIQADLMPNKPDPQVILDKIDMLIDKLKPTVKVNSSSISSSSSNTNNSDSHSNNTSTKLVLAQVDSGNIDSMT